MLMRMITVTVICLILIPTTTLAKGGIGFPSGPVKDADVVKLVLGNTLYHNDSGVSRYFEPGGKETICRNKRCGTVKWAVRDYKFCMKEGPRINQGNWWCIVDAEYNDKTGKLDFTATGNDRTYTYIVYKGEDH